MITIIDETQDRTLKMEIETPETFSVCAEIIRFMFATGHSPHNVITGFTTCLEEMTDAWFPEPDESFLDEVKSSNDVN